MTGNLTETASVVEQHNDSKKCTTIYVRSI